MTKNKELENAYFEIIKDVDDSYLNPNKFDNPLTKGLSGLFLTSVHDNYLDAKNKIMIIGRETRDWNKQGQNKFTDKKSYINQSIAYHNKFFFGQLEIGNSRGKSFHNFTRRLGKKSGTEGLIYSNLFCFSLNETTPVKSPILQDIDIISLSEKLLKAQIKILKPEIIIFMNGFDKVSVDARRQMFPTDGKNNVCLNRKNYVDDNGISNKQLWKFDLKFEDREITSYRTYHPSATIKDAKIGHDFLINLLPEL